MYIADILAFSIGSQSRLDRVELGLNGPDWGGIGQTGLDYIGQDWTVLDSVILDWTKIDWTTLYCTAKR